MNESTLLNPTQMLDWNSDICPIKLLVELPFWLKVPSHSKSVTIDGVNATVHVSNDFSAFQTDAMSLASHRNTIDLISQSSSLYDCLKNSNSVVEKPLKTVITFESHAIIDAINALFNPNEIPEFIRTNHARIQQGMPINTLPIRTDIQSSRANFGISYFRALSIGHLDLLNTIIDSYRKKVFDPFVYPVCEKDVPIWFIEFKSEFRRVFIHICQDFDWFPTYTNSATGEESPILFLEEPDHLWADLNTPMCPEIAEVCDAWVCYYSGQYEGAIRSIVTGIETAIDNGIKKSMQNDGESDVAIEQYFKKKENCFEKRYDDYCKMQKSYSPVTIPFPAQGICYDLKEMLFELREWRHDIVHDIASPPDSLSAKEQADLQAKRQAWMAKARIMPEIFEHVDKTPIELTVDPNKGGELVVDVSKY